ncbi:MAG: lipid IV(A) 3-deoxy-D-manno-octulosonic acid transferase [Pseudomonadales bacterium]
MARYDIAWLKLGHYQVGDLVVNVRVSLYPAVTLRTKYQAQEILSQVVYRILYSLVLYLLTPLTLLRLFWRSRREPLYRAFIAERFGFCRSLDSGNPRIWIHAVSAGETNAAIPLIERLLNLGYKVIVTNMTPTGRERVRTQFGPRVDHAYVPYDLPGAVTRFLDRTNPAALVIIDTEMWPNMIHLSSEREIRTLLVNARLSEKSRRGYALVAGLTRLMLDDFTGVATQTRAHGERFLSLGLAPSKLIVTGSIKFDVGVPDDLGVKSEALRYKTGGRPVFLAASTHSGEEELVLDAFKQLGVEGALLVIAPRHSYRSQAIFDLCGAREFSVVRHSSGTPIDPGTQILLLDTMGELMYFYNIATIAFVGGSFTKAGGHNPMEPASLGVPVIMGPHLRNIEDIAAEFVANGGMKIVADGEELTRAVQVLMNEEAERQALVTGASSVMEINRGALDRVEKLIVESLAQ